jgi:hypothetical protein
MSRAPAIGDRCQGDSFLSDAGDLLQFGISPQLDDKPIRRFAANDLIFTRTTPETHLGPSE